MNTDSNIAYQVDNSTQVDHIKYTPQAEWTKNATIYEVNIRQFSEEGSLNAVTAQLERIRNMGIDILWLMPVHPISKKNRKQGPDDLGSYYAVGDFRAINPEYGTMDDMENLIAKAHDLGLKVILDWVPNHTGWDHPWITEHPDYYTQNEHGEIVDPINPGTGESWGWTDVADLNFNNPEMRKAMIADMKFWVEQKGIDGFRCDVAHSVPVDFWAEAIPQLREVGGGENLFMLAEAESPELAGHFNMSYGWQFHHMLHRVLRGEEHYHKIKEDVDHYRNRFGSNHYAMMFVTNHDENSWAGTVFERYGDANKAMTVLTFTIDGMPLLYSGQEAAMDKRLEFFVKDAIDWKDYPLQDFYTELIKLKKDNPALWNGDFGGPLEVIRASDAYTYRRTKDNNSVFVAINFKNYDVEFDLPFGENEDWKLVMSEGITDANQGKLGSHGYAVWVLNK